MTFLDSWTSTYEGVPPDTENINLGANRIRDLKVNIRERANIDHSWGDAADNGRHNQVSLNISAADPPVVANTSYVYSKSVSGDMELFYRDSGGNITQITTAGTINFSPFPSGTRVPFVQSAPPTGWTQVVSFNDLVLRMVNDASGGGTGGSWTIGGTSVATTTGSLAASSGSSGSVSGTVAGHTLVAAEIPSHTHNTSVTTSGSAVVVGGGAITAALYNGAGQNYTSDGGTGGNGSHTHGWSGSISVTTTTTMSGAPGATFSNDATWRPSYVNSCIGQKT